MRFAAASVTTEQQPRRPLLPFKRNREKLTRPPARYLNRPGQDPAGNRISSVLRAEAFKRRSGIFVRNVSRSSLRRPDPFAEAFALPRVPNPIHDGYLIADTA